MPKVSVIVPVYKVENYVSRCIESVLNQTYTNWELILVDDGSPDLSGAICEEYALKDRRIKVYHKDNGGVSSARNVGLDNACGDWITFLDSDDYFESTTLQSLSDTIDIYTTADVIDFPILRDAGSKDGEKLDTSVEIIVCTNEREIDNYWFNHPRFESCGRFFKRELLSGMRFNPLLKIGEDTVFFMQYLTRCSSLVAIPNGLYAYCYRDVSAMGVARAEKLVQNDLLMLELMGAEVWKRPILAAIIYRMIIPKLQEKKLKLMGVYQYKPYIKKIRINKLLSSSLPFKAKFIVTLLKQIVRVL